MCEREGEIRDHNRHHCFGSQKTAFLAGLRKLSHYKQIVTSMKKIAVLILNKLVSLGRALHSCSSAAAGTKSM